MKAETLNPKQIVLDTFREMDSKQTHDPFYRLCADDYTFHYPLSPEPLNRKKSLEITDNIHKAFSNVKHTIQDAFVSGNKVVVRGFFSGTHTSEYNGISATGKLVKAPFIDIIEVNDKGKFKNEWLQFDTLGFMQQLGAVPVLESVHN